MKSITKLHFEFSNFYNGFHDYIYASIRTPTGSISDMLISDEWNTLYWKYEFCKLVGFVLSDSTYCVLTDKKMIFLSEFESFDVRDLQHTMVGTPASGPNLMPEHIMVSLNPTLSLDSPRTLIKFPATSIQHMLETEMYKKVNEANKNIKLVVGFDMPNGDLFVFADPIMLHNNSEVPDDFSMFERLFFKIK